MQKLLVTYFCIAFAVLAGRLTAQQLLPAEACMQIVQIDADVTEEPESERPLRARGGKKCLRQVVKVANLEIRTICILPATYPVPHLVPPQLTAESFELLFQRSGHDQLFQKS